MYQNPFGPATKKSQGGFDPIAALMDVLTTGHSTVDNNSNYTGTTPFTDMLTGKKPYALFGSDQGQPQPQPQPYDDLLALIQNMGAGGMNQADYEDALKNSAAQIKGAFGAQIGAIKASSNNARRQTKRSKRQIRKMYKALNNEYMKDAAAEVATGKDVSNQLGQIAATAQTGVEQNANQILNEEAALAKNLGVESATPDQAARLQNKVADAVSTIQQTGQLNANEQMGNSAAQQRFLVRGGKNSLLEGTNRRADLVQQLQDFLMQNQGKIADVKAARGQALAANSANIAKSMGDAQGEDFDRQYKIAQLLKSVDDAKYGMQADQQNGSGGGNPLDYLKLLAGLDNSAVQAGGDLNRSNDLYKLIMQMLANDYGMGAQ